MAHLGNPIRIPDHDSQRQVNQRIKTRRQRGGPGSSFRPLALESSGERHTLQAQVMKNTAGKQFYCYIRVRSERHDSEKTLISCSSKVAPSNDGAFAPNKAQNASLTDATLEQATLEGVPRSPMSKEHAIFFAQPCLLWPSSWCSSSAALPLLWPSHIVFHAAPAQACSARAMLSSKLWTRLPHGRYFASAAAHRDSNRTSHEGPYELMAFLG